MAVWIGLFVFSAGLVVARLMSEQGFFSDAAGFVFVAMMAAALWGVAMGVVFWRRVRDRGWDVAFVEFAIGSWRLPDSFVGGGRVLSRVDWETVPAYDSEAGEMENLAACLTMTRGWDAEIERDRRLVTVYTAEQREVAEYLRGMLADQGLVAHLEDSSAGGAYRFSFGTHLVTTARDAEEAREFLSELFEQGK